MGKTTTTKKTTPAKRAAAKVAPEAVTINETPAPAPATVTKPKAVKTAKPAAKPATAAKKKPATPKAPRSKVKKVAAMAAQFTGEDIALRAYFIAEKRQQTGEWGTPEGDWLEAERQLRAELAS